MRYLPPGLLGAWALTIAFGATLTFVWIPLLVVAVIAGVVELRRRYRDH